MIEGQSSATLLGAEAAELPWNRAFEGEAVATATAGGLVELTSLGAIHASRYCPRPLMGRHGETGAWVRGLLTVSMPSSTFILFDGNPNGMGR